MAEPVYRSNRAELTALMGEAAYAALVLRCEAHLDTVKRARSAGARQLIPLLVHPATVEAGTVGGRRTRVPRRRPATPATRTAKVGTRALRRITAASMISPASAAAGGGAPHYTILSLVGGGLRDDAPSVDTLVSQAGQPLLAKARSDCSPELSALARQLKVDMAGAFSVPLATLKL